MQTCALEAVAAPRPIFGDGLPEPMDTELLAMTDLRGGEGASGGETAAPPSRLRTAAISAALAFAMLAYVGMWAAIIGVILASMRGLIHLMGGGA